MSVDATGHGVADVFWVLVAAFECALFGECRFEPKHGERRSAGDKLAKGGPTPQPSPVAHMRGRSLSLLFPTFPSDPRAGLPHRFKVNLLAGPGPHLPNIPGPTDILKGIVDKVEGCIVGLGCKSEADRTNLIGRYYQAISIGRLIESIGFKMSLPEFKCAHDRKDFGGDGLDWSADNCTAIFDNPLGLPFQTGCERHDFTGRNLRSSYSISIHDWASRPDRDRVDRMLGADLHWVCDNSISWFVEQVIKCDDLASAYFSTVSSRPVSWYYQFGA